METLKEYTLLQKAWNNMRSLFNFENDVNLPSTMVTNDKRITIPCFV